MTDTATEHRFILQERHGKIVVLKLNRPAARNALCEALMDDLSAALMRADADDSIAVIVLTGDEKAFAAGADIGEMKDKTFIDAYRENFITRNWETAARIRKPLIAAVAGYALGGGCELAMMCDFIIAADSARFGQPEITIGILPGAGGTQRLTRLIGKGKAMELCLTGRMMDATEAEKAGLVARVVPAADLMAETLKIAEKIAGYSQIAAIAVKEAVKEAEETTLSQGLRYERRLFHALFSSEDQKEGMTAFSEKRIPEFKNR
jgi:enoyl-CoA hydratase